MNKQCLSFLIVFGAFLSLTGCVSSGVTSYLPTPGDLDNVARVTVLRNKNFYSAGLVSKVTLDGFVIARLGPGRHITFAVDAGPHSIGITESSASLELLPSEHYYFLVSVAPGGQGFESERVPVSLAQAYLTRSTAVA